MLTYCPQCGVTYGIMGHYKVFRKICRHLMYQNCWDARGSCLQCSSSGPSYTPETSGRRNVHAPAPAGSADFPNNLAQRGVDAEETSISIVPSTASSEVEREAVPISSAEISAAIFAALLIQGDESDPPQASSAVASTKHVKINSAPGAERRRVTRPATRRASSLQPPARIPSSIAQTPCTHPNRDAPPNQSALVDSTSTTGNVVSSGNGDPQQLDNSAVASTSRSGTFEALTSAMATPSAALEGTGLNVDAMPAKPKKKKSTNSEGQRRPPSASSVSTVDPSTMPHFQQLEMLLPRTYFTNAPNPRLQKMWTLPYGPNSDSSE
ncbi:unnamed protein product [Orchesella dallaii]|uniref:RING-type domain-containing protein n=1 Tax=Orchesella dallaii TaxID=48710 RepID=A0ABP1PW96_9HEXA